MILPTIILALGFSWLMVETDWLRIRLPYGSIPEENHDHIKRHPRIDTGEVKECSYPETKLLAEMCYVTKLEHELTRKYFRSFATGRDSYQTMTIGGNLLTVNSHNPKLYDVINEAVSIFARRSWRPRVICSARSMRVRLNASLKIKSY